MWSPGSVLGSSEGSDPLRVPSYIPYRSARSSRFCTMRIDAASTITPSTLIAPSPCFSASRVRRFLFARRRDRVGRGREDLLGDLDLARMNRPLADHTERVCAFGLAPVTVRIAEVRVRTVDRVDAVRATRDRHLVARVVPDVAGVGAGFADRHHLHLLARRVVAHTEDQAFEPVGTRGDFVDVHHAFDFFDEAFDADTPRQPELALRAGRAAGARTSRRARSWLSSA